MRSGYSSYAFSQAERDEGVSGGISQSQLTHMYDTDKDKANVVVWGELEGKKQQ